MDAILEMLDPYLSKSSKEVAEHLYEAKDLVSIVITGHILVEEHLNRLLEVALANPRYVIEQNFSFHKKVCILRALGDPTASGSRYWEAITILNQIRNKLAHKLNPKEVSNLSSKYIQVLSDDVFPGDALRRMPIELQIKGSIGLLGGFLTTLGILSS